MTDNDGIKAIIFDLGNVLVDFDHLIAARKISRFTDKTAQEIFDLFFDSQLTALFEEGRISPQEFFAGVKEKLNLNLSYEEFVPTWNEIFFFSPKNEAVYKLAKALKKNYKLVLLSNINFLHFEYLKKEFGVFDAFDYIVTSFEAGCRKPSPSIYKKTLEILKEKPENVFYTDDRQDLISKAAEMDIRSCVFTGMEKLQRDLFASGVRIN